MIGRRGYRRAAGRGALHLLAGALLVLMAGPLAWMLAGSFKTQGEALAIPSRLLPATPQWGNYVAVFAQVPFARFMLNSLLIASTVTVVALLLHSMAAYSLARLRYPGRELLFVGVLSTLMVPFTVIVIPLFIIIKALGWVDTYQALIVPAIPNAFGIYLLRQFYISLPRDLEEAALIDGASRLQVYWHVILPLSRPIMGALGILFFLANWNSFLWPLIVTQSPDHWVVQLGIQHFIGEHTTAWNLVMAASTVAALPTVAVFFLLQRQLVEGIKMTGIKG